MKHSSSTEKEKIMLTNNLNDSVNHIPLLSQEMERTLRRLAWKDETFREALIADPKGVIQQVFPHCFPDGKIADNLTIKVIEEDPFTHHIVLPALPDQFPILEIPDEQQVDLIANMSRIRCLEGHPSYGAETCFPSSHDASGCGQQDQRKRVKSESKQKKSIGSSINSQGMMVRLKKTQCLRVSIRMGQRLKRDALTSRINLPRAILVKTAFRPDERDRLMLITCEVFS
jgi:hypothetical protein